MNYAEGDTIKDLIVRDYPFIEKWKKRLLPVWKNKKDFKDFIIKIHKPLFLGPKKG